MIGYPFFPAPLALWDSEKPYNQLPLAAKITLSKLIQLDRTARWYDPPQVDASGNVYVIFSLAQVQALVGCKEEKAGKILKLLSEKDYIRRVHQGQGKPDRIYVNNLDLGSIQQESTSGLVQSFDPVNCRKQLERQIHFEELVTEFGFDLVNDIVNTIVNALRTKNKVVTVSGNEYDGQYYRQRLLSTQEEHVRYVIRRLNSMRDPLYSPAAYILARLWESYNGTSLLFNGDSEGNNKSQTCRWSDEEIEEIRRYIQEDIEYGDPI